MVKPGFIGVSDRGIVKGEVLQENAEKGKSTNNIPSSLRLVKKRVSQTATNDRKCNEQISLCRKLRAGKEEGKKKRSLFSSVDSNVEEALISKINLKIAGKEKTPWSQKSASRQGGKKTV